MLKQNKLNKLKALGYDIEISRSTGTNVVTFTGKFVKPYTLPQTYSFKWQDNDIRKDVVDELLDWSGYKVIETLQLDI